MNVWLRRLLVLLLVVFWLALLMVPTLAVVLARKGQLQLGDSDGRHWRLFLLQEADFEGLGLERARAVAPPLSAPAANCLQITVSYWLWTGEGQPATYCRCLDPNSGADLPDVPPACQSP